MAQPHIKPLNTDECRPTSATDIRRSAAAQPIQGGRTAIDYISEGGKSGVTVVCAADETGRKLTIEILKFEARFKCRL